MIELYLSKNMIEGSAAYGKYYPRVSYKQTMNIHDMAKHMAEHNTPFSEGTIEGILRDFVKCTREQTLLGNTVKVDDLAIFKVSVIGNGCAVLYDKENDKTITASIGEIGKDDRTGPSVQSLKLLAQATGEYTREELNKVAKLGWTDKTEDNEVVLVFDVLDHVVKAEDDIAAIAAQSHHATRPHRVDAGDSLAVERLGHGVNASTYAIVAA